jgi:3-dehydroquinate synthase
MVSVKVPLGNRGYTIRIGAGALDELGPRCQGLGLGRRCAIVSDTHVAPLYGGRLEASLRKAGFEPVTIEVRAGEKSKRLQVVGHCLDRLAHARLERRSFVVALGGGVVGDLAGFVAATYLRGIAFVQVPTSLLAQVDSSVGGKVGVNLAAGKNLVGAFHQPRLVLCDVTTLRTLPRRELAAGFSEVVKYGVIRDARLFARLEREADRLMALDEAVLTAVIARCCRIKAEVVGQDETEGGVRAILNFGHTIGHALEAIHRYGRLLHGEAIAIGQVAAARLSERRMGFPAADTERLRRLLDRIGLPTELRLAAARQDDWMRAMRLDKKVRDGQIRFVLARRLGQVRHGQTVAEDEITELLHIRRE